MRRRLARTFGVAALAACTASLAAMDAGVAQCDITPDVVNIKVPMAGYGARMGKPSTGVHDPIRAKVLILRDGAELAALVTTDLRSVTPELKAKTIGKAAGLGLNTANVMMCASHTHSGPSIFAEKFWQIQFGKHDPQIVEMMAERIAGAMKEAFSGLRPAAVGFASKRVEGFTRNRRWEYDQAAREAAGEKPATDPLLTVMRVDSVESNSAPACLAILVNFATHPTILGAENMLISAEWPGALQRRLETDFPGSVALFANGAEGDQSPSTASLADPFARVEEFGSRLADEAAALAKTINCEPARTIRTALVEPELPEIIFSEGAKSGPNKMLAQAALEALPRRASIQAVRIGDRVLVGLPGEPICEVGQAARRSVEAAGAKQAIIMGLANDYIGYIVNDREYSHGGYEVDSRSYYGPGLGDFVAGQAGLAAARAMRD